MGSVLSFLKSDCPKILQIELYTFLFIRTSNFGAEAERSYFFLRFEPENVLSMFLKLCGIVFQ